MIRLRIVVRWGMSESLSSSRNIKKMARSLGDSMTLIVKTSNDYGNRQQSKSRVR